LILAENNKKLLSIGGVAKLTGISVFKLRMWERRYGAPTSVKLPSGHRRYTEDEVEKIKLVKLTLDQGYKISRVAPLPTEELKKLLGENFHSASPEKKVSDILERSTYWNEQSLLEIFENDWKSLGPLGFVTSRATDLLESVGNLWKVGNLSVAQEHFISGALEKFLLQKWTDQNIAQNGKNCFLVSSLERESHQFGLQFCSVTITTAGSKVITLYSMPEIEIANAAIENKCIAVCLSVSVYYEPEDAIRRIKKLRSLLPEPITLIVGGRGAPGYMDGVLAIANFEGLYDWALKQEQESRSKEKKSQM
jgi:MerR family transcriptional regulator, light-induced transcriptional regulator